MVASIVVRGCGVTMCIDLNLLHKTARLSIHFLFSENCVRVRTNATAVDAVENKNKQNKQTINANILNTKSHQATRLFPRIGLCMYFPFCPDSSHALVYTFSTYLQHCTLPLCIPSPPLILVRFDLNFIDLQIKSH